MTPLTVGDRVFAFRHGDPNSKCEFPATISKIHEDGTVDVNYDDGDIDTKVPINATRKVFPESTSKAPYHAKDVSSVDLPKYPLISSSFIPESAPRDGDIAYGNEEEKIRSKSIEDSNLPETGATQESLMTLQAVSNTRNTNNGSRTGHTKKKLLPSHLILEKIRAAVMLENRKLARHFFGTQLSLRSFASLLLEKMGVSMITNEDLLKFAKCFDYLGYGMIDGFGVLSCVMCFDIVVDSRPVSNSLNSVRRFVFHGYQEENSLPSSKWSRSLECKEAWLKLQSIERQFREFDLENTGVVTADDARIVLDRLWNSNKRSKSNKDTEAIVGSNCFQCRKHASQELDDDSSDSHLDKPGFAQSPGFRYELFLSLIYIPELTRKKLTSNLQPALFLARQIGIDFGKEASQLRGRVAIDIVDFILRYGLPLTPEAILLLGDSTASDFYRPLHFLKWLASDGFVTDPLKPQALSHAVNKLYPALMFCDNGQPIKSLESFLVALNERIYHSKPNLNSGQVCNTNKIHFHMTRKRFAQYICEEFALRDDYLNAARVIMEALDENCTGTIDCRSFYILLRKFGATNYRANDASSSGSSTDKESFSATDDEDDKLNFMQREDPPAKLIQAETIHAAASRLKYNRGTADQKLSKLFESYKNAEAGSAFSLLSRRSFREICRKKLQLSLDATQVLSIAFSTEDGLYIEVDDVCQYVKEVKLPNLDIDDQIAASSMRKLRAAVRRMEARARKDPCYLILSNRKVPLKSKVKSILKIKSSNKSVKKAHINAVLSSCEWSESKVARYLADKYNIDWPPVLSTELSKLLPYEDDDSIAVHEAIVSVCHLLDIKLKPIELERLILSFKTDFVPIKFICDMLQPRCDSEKLSRKMSRVSQLAKDQGIQFQFEALKRRCGPDELLPENEFLHIVYDAGLPFLQEELSCLIHSGDPSGVGKLMIRRIFDLSHLSNVQFEQSHQHDIDQNCSNGELSENLSEELQDEWSVSSVTPTPYDNFKTPTDYSIQNPVKKQRQSKTSEKRPQPSLDLSASKEDKSRSDKASLKSSRTLAHRSQSCILSHSIRNKLLKRYTRDRVGDDPECKPVYPLIISAFTSADINKNGTLAVNLFRNTLQKPEHALGLSDTDIDKLVRTVKTQSQKLVDYFAFLAFFEPRFSSRERKAMSLIRKAFKKIGYKRSDVLESFFDKSNRKRKPKGKALIDEDDFFAKVSKTLPSLRLSDIKRRIIMERFDPYNAGKINLKAFVDVVFPDTGDLMAIKSLERRLNRFLPLVTRSGIFLRDLLDELSIDKNIVDETTFRNVLFAIGIPLLETEVQLLLVCLNTSGDGMLDLRKLSQFFKGHGTLPRDNYKPRKKANHRFRSKSPEYKPDIASEEDASQSFKTSSDTSPESRINKSDTGFKTSSASESSAPTDSEWTSSTCLSSWSDYKSVDRDETANSSDICHDEIENRYMRDLTRAIKTSFDILDEDGNGVIDENELGRVLQALKQNCGPEDVTEAMREGDFNGDGLLDRREFVKLVKKIVLGQATTLAPRRETDIRNVFQKLDLNGDGVLSRDEFEQAMNKLLTPNANRRTQIKTQTLNKLFQLADSDEDGTVSYEEFIEFLRTLANSPKKTKKLGLSNKDASLLHSLIRGPVPDPVEYLKMFRKAPMHFRLFETKDYEKAVQHGQRLGSLGRNEIVIKDLHRKTGWRSKKRLIIQEPSVSFLIQLRSASGVSVFVNDTLADRAYNRSAVVSLYRLSDTEEFNGNNQTGDYFPQKANSEPIQSKRSMSINSQTDRSRCISNSYRIGAKWDSSAEDLWIFSKFLDSSLSTLVIRASKRVLDSCESNGEKLCLLVALTVSVSPKKKPSANHQIHNNSGMDMCCGWSMIDLGSLEKFKNLRQDIKLELHGGLPEMPADIQDADIQGRRSGWRKLAQILQRKGSIQTPILTLRCRSIESMSHSSRQAIKQLPSNFITPKASLPLIKVYNLLQERKSTMAFSGYQFDPVLRIFPQIVKDADLLAILVKKWTSISTVFTLHPKRRIEAFSEAVLSMWPHLSAIEKHGEKTSNSTVFQSRAKPSPTLFFYSCPDSSRSLLVADKSVSRKSQSGYSAFGPETNDGNMLFKPFNVKETAV